MMTSRREFLGQSALAMAGLTLGLRGGAAPDAGQTPNIVYVLADDMGFGDVACYDPQYSKIPTPNIDRLAGQGMRFTAAHTACSVCSPTRYGLLTGRYPWRSALQRGVLRPYDPPLIGPDRLTLPKFLKRHGYHTGCVGKWHLGWDWPKDEATGKHRYDRPIANGPTTRGFDFYFGTDVPNYPPYTFVENDRVAVQPTGHFAGDKAINVGQPGDMAPGWRFDQIMPTLTERAVGYIGERAKTGKPFFLYFPLTIPHEPITPSENFKGQSGISAVADLIMEVDATVGRVMEALEKGGVAENTLLIFTTDNGHCPYTGLEPFEKAGHRVSGPFRGVKSTAWEGGTRVPFIARWPGRIKPAGLCDRVVCHNDLLATLADHFGETLPADAAEDSVSILPLLRDPAAPPVRADVVTLSVTGRFCIQRGPWKLIVAPGAGGYGAAPTDEEAVQQGLPAVQLYNVEEDPAEKKNLQAEQPEWVKALRVRLDKYIHDGRSTPGAAQRNDVEVILDKPIPKPAAAKAAKGAKAGAAQKKKKK